MQHHSPGPWEAIQEAIDPNDPIGDAGAWHCYTGTWRYYRPSKSTFWTKADAILMAAAPDLLDVVMSMMKYYRLGETEGDGLSAELYLMEKAEAALKKAGIEWEKMT